MRSDDPRGWIAQAQAEVMKFAEVGSPDLPPEAYDVLADHRIALAALTAVLADCEAADADLRPKNRASGVRFWHEVIYEHIAATLAGEA